MAKANLLRQLISKLEMAKTNLLRQKQIRNGNSQLVKVDANSSQQKQIVNCTITDWGSVKQLTNTKIVQVKTKIDQQNQWGKVFWSQKQKAYDKSKLVTLLQLITSQKQAHLSQKQITFMLRKSTNSYLGSLSIHSQAQHCRILGKMESVRYWYSSVK